MAHVTFLGACGVVTGSATLLEWGDTRLLVDCGMYQGGEELEQRNHAPFPFDPAGLTAVLLTHAHLDHSGLLPRLASAGFEGPIYCSRASRALVRLILEDAGKIQEEQARYARKKGYSRHAEPQPLYDGDDVRRTLKQLSGVPFDEEREVVPGVRVRFTRAGHLLGAASITVEAKGGDGSRRRWLFSGDVGRYGVPILVDPQGPPEAPDALLLESTYGDRDQHPQEDSAERLGEIVDETFRRGGFVIVPAFALGRTQEVLYHLGQLAEQGRIDPADVFLDSPMAITATDLYAQAKSEHDEELAELVAAGDSPLAADAFVRCRTVDESKRLNSRRRPAVVVAASGMANGGRVVHHLLRRLDDPATSVVFTGYQASGTRGRALLDGADTVGIHGNRVRVKAAIHSLQGLSAHADRSELLRWCEALPGRPARIFLNHGEDPARKALAAELQEMGWPRPVLPVSGERHPW
ncbi:MAG TPA: MBL fold metallo-hydrolase [Thermoanaerobaculia bacterium]|nr:MBL fold metallo-hydrolase [Thermoanaerobaculia bacterium]